MAIKHGPEPRKLTASGPQRETGGFFFIHFFWGLGPGLGLRLRLRLRLGVLWRKANVSESNSERECECDWQAVAVAVAIAIAVAVVSVSHAASRRPANPPNRCHDINHSLFIPPQKKKYHLGIKSYKEN